MPSIPLFFYLAKMLWPVKLVPFYPFPNTINFFDLTYYSISVIVALIITGRVHMAVEAGETPVYSALSGHTTLSHCFRSRALFRSAARRQQIAIPIFPV